MTRTQRNLLEQQKNRWDTLERRDTPWTPLLQRAPFPAAWLTNLAASA